MRHFNFYLTLTIITENLSLKAGVSLNLVIFLDVLEVEMLMIASELVLEVAMTDAEHGFRLVILQSIFVIFN